MSNYREIPAMLRSRVPFSGNSMSAHYDRNGDYVVMSYATEIARMTRKVTPEGGLEVIMNDRKYSTTTSRHQNLVRANL
jgi:hypothetical protein